MRYAWLLALLLSACATSEEFARKNAEFDHPGRQIVYLVSDNPSRDCGIPAVACARFDASQPLGVCVIVHGPNPHPTVLEHERLHCRYGRWHA